MYALLSPAKRLNFDNVSASIPQSQPALFGDTKKIVAVMKGKSGEDLKSLMGLSDKLAELNYQRYQDFDKTNNPHNHAIFAFDGDTYTGLNAQSLLQDELLYAQEHVGMLSGLYGLLRPFDMIQPYRLEMGTNISVEDKKDLYEFWSDRITKTVNEQIKASKATAVINLASNEYIKSINKNKLSVPFLDIDFKEMKDGKAKTIGIHAKKARGMMARFMVQNRVEEPEGLKAFDWVGYEFQPDMSSGSTFVFVR